MSKNHETNSLDRVSQIKAKHLFMLMAISELWGSDHSIYGENVVFGCQLFMDSIQDDLEELQELLEKDTSEIKPKDIANIKSIKKEA